MYPNSWLNALYNIDILYYINYICQSCDYPKTAIGDVRFLAWKIQIRLFSATGWALTLGELGIANILGIESSIIAAEPNIIT